MNFYLLGITFVLALLISIYGTPIAINVAKRYQIMDIPDGKLKLQKSSVPYLGGMAIYFSFIMSSSFFFFFDCKMSGIILSASMLLIIGLFDDLKAMTPGHKFLFQCLASFIAVKSGIAINLASLPVYLNYALSFFWILSLINALNIIDIMDGFASCVGLLISLSLAFINIKTGNLELVVLSLSLSGALLGFLKYNKYPAQIYLGDSGSMFLGLTLACLLIMTDYCSKNELGFTSALILPAIPLFDISYVILIRLAKKKSPFRGSPDHFVLRLKKKYNFNSGQALRVIAIIQLFLAITAVVNIYINRAGTIILLASWLVLFIILGLILLKVKMERK